MVQFSVRPLNRKEKLQLRKEIRYAGSLRKKWFWFCLGAIVLVLVIGTPLAVSQAKEDSALGKLAFGTLAVYVFVVMWVYFSNTREAARRFRDHTRALQHDTAEVVRCRSSQVLEIVEEEDLPAIYFFEVEDDGAFCCEMYRDDSARVRFPCSEFEVSRVTNGDEKLLILELDCTGDGLSPRMSLSGQAARDVLARFQLPDVNFALLREPFGVVEEAFLGMGRNRGEL